jgi:transposase
MKTLNQKTSAEVNGLSVLKKYQVIKLGIDWHASYYRVVRIIDEAAPEPAQRFTPEGFLTWVGKQLTLAEKVYCCYEAGAGGFVLHRQLTALGAINFVVVPRDLDSEHKGVRNDPKEARELAQNLDRYVRGNDKAMRVVRVPTPEQEQKRQQSRQRDQMHKHRLAFAAQGRCLLLAQGWKESNNWWRPQRWKTLCARLPKWLGQALEIYHRLIVEVERELKTLTAAVAKAASPQRAHGMGALTLEQIDREVCDWKRFGNRKQAASYVGLVGGVSQSGASHRDLSITKAGHIPLRRLLVELAWRMVFYQSQTRLIQKWKCVLLNPKAHKRARKKAIIAVARQLMVDLWRWRTGRITAQELGWKMTADSVPTAA